MTWFLFAIQLGLAGIFLLAATGKALWAEEFKAALRLSRLPEPLVAPASAIVPIVELGMAVALVLQTPQSLRIAFVTAAAVLATFTAWMVGIRARGLHVRCGCFGTGSTEIGPRSIWRNLALLALALSGSALAWQTSSPLPGPSIWLVITVTAVGLWVALFVALRTALPQLVLDLGHRGLDPGHEG